MRLSLTALATLVLLSACGSPPRASDVASSKPANRNGLGGADHVGLTVTDLEASGRFFREVLDFRLLREDPSYPAQFLSNGHIIVTLWRAEDPATATPFDRRKNVGLHHLAFSATSLEALEALFAKVEAFPGVVVEFSPEPLMGGPARHAIFREPSGNRLELIYRPKPSE